MREQRIIGIDLGTTNSVMAYWDRITGKPVVIPNADGELLTPSVVGLDEDGEILVGRKARNQIYTNPENTIASVKREMGTKKQYILKGEEKMPHHISATILEFLKKQAASYLQNTIDRAVITFPVRFGEAQIDATRMAGELAGLIVSGEPQLIDEPSASLMAAYVSQEIPDGVRAVYDLGGGTFDIAIMVVTHGRPVLKGTDGDPYLGGDDFDHLLSKWILDELKWYHDFELSKETSEGRAALQRLKIAVEDAKIKLSSEEEASILISELCNDKNGNVVNVDLKITRSQFEELIREKIESTIPMCEKALAKAKMYFNDVDEILLVGGSTKIPLVAKIVEQAFGKAPRTDLDADTCVAEGAAIYAHAQATETMRSKGDVIEIRFPIPIPSPTPKKMLSIAGKVRAIRSGVNIEGARVIVQRGDSQFKTQAKLNKTNGFLLKLELQAEVENAFELIVQNAKGKELGRYSFEIKHDSKAVIPRPPQVLTPYPLSVGLKGGRIAVLIEKDTPLPAKKTQTFFTTEDEQKTLYVPVYEGEHPKAERNKQISEVRVTNIPPGLKEGTEVKVTFDINKDRTIHVTVDIPSASIGGSAEIVPEWPDTNLEKQRAKVEELKEDIRKRADLVPPEDKPITIAKVEKAIEEVDEAIKDGEEGRADAKRRELENLKEELENMALDLDKVEHFRDIRGKALTLANQVATVKGNVRYSQEIPHIIRQCEDAIEKANKENFESKFSILRQQYIEMLRILSDGGIDRQMITNFLQKAKDEALLYAYDSNEETRVETLFTQGQVAMVSGNFSQAVNAVERLEQLAKAWEDRGKITD